VYSPDFRQTQIKDFRRKQTGAVKNRKELHAHWSCPLSLSCTSKYRKAVQSVSRSVSQQRSDPWSAYRIRKQLIASLDILIFLTLYKLAHLPFRRKILFMWSNSSSDAAEVHCFVKTHFRAHYWALELRKCLKPGFKCQNSITWMHLIFHWLTTLCSYVPAPIQWLLLSYRISHGEHHWASGVRFRMVKGLSHTRVLYGSKSMVVYYLTPAFLTKQNLISNVINKTMVIIKLSK